MKEDRFQFEINDDCIKCGRCAKVCPTKAIAMGAVHMEIDKSKCVDCGTCSIVCPVGAANSGSVKRASIQLDSINPEKLYLNPGCAISQFKPYLPPLMFAKLKEYFPKLQMHNICCRNNPQLPTGSTIIANCAGCDRRFRSLYEGVQTISFWELLDSLDNLELPDYQGIQMSVHDSCGYRHKPQVHAAIRSLLRKMNIKIVEAKFKETNSVCCGDNLYGIISNDAVKSRMKVRAKQMPCEDVAVTCIGCIEAMQIGGKKPHHLLDLLFNQDNKPMMETLEEYHDKLEHYIAVH